MAVLTQSFFKKPTLEVAEKMVGAFLVRRLGRRIIRLRITETEAYLGEDDLASHARFGRDKRGRMMYEKPGTIYIYLVYGMYWMLNIVTEGKGTAGAVLIRSAGDYKGPGRLTEALGIGKKFNGKFADRITGLWFEKRKGRLQVGKSPRIGIQYAGPLWSKKPYRFFVKK